MEPTIKQVCAQCKDEWLTEAEYNSHVCPKSGVAPTDPANLGEDFAAIQKAALERGLETAKDDGDAIQIAKNEEAIQQLAVSETVANTPVVDTAAPVSPPAEAVTQAPLVLQ